MRADGSRPRVLIDGPRNESEPDYAPDGRRIAFVSNRFGRSNVFLAGSGGGRVQQQLTHSFVARFPSYHHPVFSPNGKSVAALSIGTRTSGIVVIERDRGSTLFQSFDSAGTEEEGFGSTLGDPAWGPRPR